MNLYANKDYPEQMQPELLDSYLARGWYRMGQTIFTTHFLSFNNRLHSAIWIRSQLNGFRFSKNQRKLMRKNAERFETHFQPSVITPEKERLFQRYREDFPGVLAPSLRDSLLDSEDYNIYNTYEVQLIERETGRLVGLSFFDLGEESAASILGIYDPDYKSQSLGFYTMMCEVQFSLERGLKFFYPGYVVPGYPRFDYKQRLRNSEYYDVAQDHWEPLEELDESKIPLVRIRRRLLDLISEMKRMELPGRFLYYPYFEAPLYGFIRSSYLDHPVIILIDAPLSQFQYLIVYHLRREMYQLIRCNNTLDQQLYFQDSYVNSFDPEIYLTRLVIVRDVVLERADARDMARALEQFGF